MLHIKALLVGLAIFAAIVFVFCVIIQIALLSTLATTIIAPVVIILLVLIAAYALGCGILHH